MFKNRKQNMMAFFPPPAENKPQAATAPAVEDTSKALPSPKRKGKKGGGSDALINAGSTIGMGSIL